MKRLLILLTTFSVMFAKASFSQPIEVSLPDTSATENTQIAIPIRVGDLTGRNVIAYQTRIAFDEGVLDALSASSSGTLSGAFGPPTVNMANDGEISVGGFGTSPLSGSGTLVELIFNVVGQSQDTTNLIIDTFVFNSGDPPAQLRNGKFTVAFPTGIGDTFHPPNVFVLRQNYPNPFNPQTSITIEVPTNWQSPVLLQIFNVHGQVVKTVQNGILAHGVHTMIWDGKDAAGEPAATGQYIYKLISGNFVSVRKMLLVK